MKIPGTVITALSTLIIFTASYYLDADQVGAIVSGIVTVALALLKAWQVQQPGDETVTTRGVEQRSKLNRWLLG